MALSGAVRLIAAKSAHAIKTVGSIYSAVTQMLIARASKWFYGAYFTRARGELRGPWIAHQSGQKLRLARATGVVQVNALQTSATQIRRLALSAHLR